MVSALSGHLTSLLNARQLDLAILFDAQSARRWSVQPLLEEKLYLIQSKRSPVCPHTATTTMAQMGGVPLILPSGSHGLRNAIVTAFAHAGLPLNMALEIDGLPLLMEAVMAGMGATVQPWSAVKLHHATQGEFLWSEIVDGQVRRPAMLCGLSEDRAVARCAGRARGAARLRRTIGDQRHLGRRHPEPSQKLIPPFPAPPAQGRGAPYSRSSLRVRLQGERFMDTDVLVIGGGNAALCAALMAREAGARVLLLESAPREWRGGNSAHTRNLRCMHDAPQDVLVEAYPEEEYWQDLLKVTGGITNEHLARMVIRASSTCRNWMRKHGVHFQPPLSGALHVARTNAFFMGGGKALVNAYYRSAEALGVEIRYESPVDRIEIDNGVFKPLMSKAERITGQELRAGSGRF